MTLLRPSLVRSAEALVHGGAPAALHAVQEATPLAAHAAADAAIVRTASSAGTSGSAVAQAVTGQRQLTIAVLGEHSNPSVVNIAHELTSLGHNAPIYDLNEFGLVRGSDTRDGVDALLLGAQPMPQLDGAVAYHGAMVPSDGLRKMRALERSGVVFVNPPKAIAISRDKWLSADAMQKQGVRTPTTRLLHGGSDLDAMVAELGSPTIFKLRIGTEGRGVFKVSDAGEARPIAETIFATGHNLVGQQMVKMAQPADVRAFVVDGRVVSAMERSAPVRANGLQDFRTNVSNGGTAAAISLHPDDAATAIAAGKAMGLDVAGVDLMGDPGHMYVIEANSGPGQKISEVTGVNVASHIAKAAERKVGAAARPATITAGGPAPQVTAIAQAQSGVRHILITVADRGEISEAPRYLQQRIREAGHHADVARLSEMTVDPAGMVLHNGAPLPGYEAVIARGGAELTPADLEKLRALQATGVPVLNPPDAIEIAGNKHLTSIELNAAGIPHPATAFVSASDLIVRRAEIQHAIAATGSKPLVIKPAKDLGGNGVVFLSGRGDLPADKFEISVRSVIDDKLPKTSNGLMVQEWLLDASSSDSRLFFTNDSTGFHVTGAYERVAPAGVGTANVSKGAVAHAITPDAEQRELAMRAAQKIGLTGGAVDFIKTGKGWVVIEVNSSAGVRAGTQHDAGGDVAGSLVNQALRVAAEHAKAV